MFFPVPPGTESPFPRSRARAFHLSACGTLSKALVSHFFSESSAGDVPYMPAADNTERRSQNRPSQSPHTRKQGTSTIVIADAEERSKRTEPAPSGQSTITAAPALNGNVPVDGPTHCGSNNSIVTSHVNTCVEKKRSSTSTSAHSCGASATPASPALASADPSTATVTAPPRTPQYCALFVLSTSVCEETCMSKHSNRVLSESEALQQKHEDEYNFLKPVIANAIERVIEAHERAQLDAMKLPSCGNVPAKLCPPSARRPEGASPPRRNGSVVGGAGGVEGEATAATTPSTTEEDRVASVTTTAATVVSSPTGGRKASNSFYSIQSCGGGEDSIAFAVLPTVAAAASFDFSPFSTPIPAHDSAYHLLKSLIKYTYTSPSAIVVACLYLDRLLCKYKNLFLSRHNVYKLLTTAMRVASKVMDTRVLNNRDFATVGNMTNEELNALEIYFLTALDYELYLSEKEFRIYTEELVAFALGHGSSPTAPPDLTPENTDQTSFSSPHPPRRQRLVSISRHALHHSQGSSTKGSISVTSVSALGAGFALAQAEKPQDIVRDASVSAPLLSSSVAAAAVAGKGGSDGGSGGGVKSPATTTTAPSKDWLSTGAASSTQPLSSRGGTTKASESVARASARTTSNNVPSMLPHLPPQRKLNLAVVPIVKERQRKQRKTSDVAENSQDDPPQDERVRARNPLCQPSDTLLQAEQREKHSRVKSKTRKRAKVPVNTVKAKTAIQR